MRLLQKNLLCACAPSCRHSHLKLQNEETTLHSTSVASKCAARTLARRISFFGSIRVLGITFAGFARVGYRIAKRFRDPDTCQLFNVTKQDEC